MNKDKGELSLSQEICIFDLEWTSWEGSKARAWSGPNEHREIFQIGAIRLSKKFEEIDHLSLLIRPKINPNLSEYAKSLTGISQEDIDKYGIDSKNGLEKLSKFLGNTLSLCMGSDIVSIEETCLINNIPNPINQKIKALSPWLKSVGIDTSKTTSGMLHFLTDTPLSGKTHNALHDVRSIAHWLKHVKITEQFPIFLRADNY